MDEIGSHHFETMGNHCFLVYTWESSIQGFLGGAGYCPSTVVDFVWPSLGLFFESTLFRSCL